ncbi:ureide permease [Striga asiatica]|uniref:Ureide permease n=1 Tax=Striga asiatica TaxID=4170 RepID=A0A5A7QMW1_STRAF|nr:ureide permease [Striga asiatica]
MYMVESKGGAIGCMVGALVLLGSWPAMLAELERRGRLPQHTYLDYSLTNFFTACLLAFTIVCLGSAVHSSNAADNAAKLKIAHSSTKDNIENGSRDDEGERKQFGSANHLIELENNRAIKVLGKSIWVGLGITLFGGMCYALFSPAFNLATNDQWHAMRHGVAHLVVYTAFFYFSLSFLVVALVLNIWLLYRPPFNLPKSSFKAYIRDWNGRNWALLAGVVCGLGNGLQFMGGQAAGYAAADCVQALPLVSTFWKIVVLGEYRRSSKRTYVLLVSMLIMFIVAVGVLIASSGHRKASS